jgi:hypothetical protein
MSMRFWQIVAAAAWIGVLVVAALVLAFHSRTTPHVRPAWRPAALERDAPSAFPRMTDAADARTRAAWQIRYERRSPPGLPTRELQLAR